MTKLNVVFDLDGTIACADARLHYVMGKKKDWHSFFEEIPNDPPFQPMIDLIQTLHRGGNTVILQTGRPEQYRRQTSEWLNQHGLSDTYDILLMRENGDHCANTVLKLRFLEWIIDYLNTKNMLWIEDSVPVVQMINRQGVLALSAEHFVEGHEELVNSQEIPFSEDICNDHS